MELEINNAFEKHYKEYRSKEDAAKTVKTLKKQIKEMEESSSSSSDSEFEECYKNKFVEQCDNILKKISNIGSDALKVNAPLFDDIIVDKKTDEIKKLVSARDLNRKILFENNGIEDENVLNDMEKVSKIESDEFVNQFKKEVKLDLENASEDEEFLRPLKNQIIFDKHQELESNVLESSDSDCCDGEADTESMTLPTIQINRDRRLETVRVSKTLSRAEKRKKRKENKEKELKEKMKRLKEIKSKSQIEKLEKIKKNIPQLADYLKIEDMDDDFDVHEFSKRMTDIFEREDSNMPIDEEKPVFSDDSDMDNIPILNEYFNEVLDVDKSSNEKRNESTKQVKNDSYFTNINVSEEKNPKKKVGILRRTEDCFDPQKYKNYQQYLKKTFDFFCEDIILGKNDDDDILCKFKFRNVEKQDYGLETEEIILADDKELNKWASLKKIVRLRSKDEEEKDRKKYSKENMQHKKKEILKSLYEEKEVGQEREPSENEENKLHKTDPQTEVSKSSKKRLRKLANKKRLKEECSTKKKVSDSRSGEVESESKKTNTDTVLQKSKKVRDETDTDDKEPPVKKLKSENGKSLDLLEKQKDKGVKKSIKHKQESCLENTIVANEEVQMKKEKHCSRSIKESSQCEDEKDNEKSRKKKQKKSTTVPVLSENRLASFGIKPGFYKYVMCDKK